MLFCKRIKLIKQTLSIALRCGILNPFYLRSEAESRLSSGLNPLTKKYA